MTSLTGIYSHVIIVFGTEEIWNGQEDMRDDVVKKIVEELDRSQTVGGFNHNQMKDILQGLRENITNDIDGNRGGRLRGAE